MQTTREQFQNVPVRKLIWKLGVPAMLAQFLNVMYGIVDRFFVGQIQGEGELSLGAVGVCVPAVGGCDFAGFGIPLAIADFTGDQ